MTEELRRERASSIRSQRDTEEWRKNDTFIDGDAAETARGFRGQEHFLYPGSLLYNAIKKQNLRFGHFLRSSGYGKDDAGAHHRRRNGTHSSVRSTLPRRNERAEGDTGRGEVQVLRAGKQDDLSLCRRVSPLEQASAGFSAEGAGGGRHTFYRKYHGKSLFCRK